MKRLRDLPPDSKLLARAQELLEAAPPLPESRERMLRVRRALDAEPRGLLAGVRRLSAAAAAALVVLFGASAFAALRIYTAVTEPSAPEAAEDAAERAVGTRRRAAPPAQREREPQAATDATRTPLPAPAVAAPTAPAVKPAAPAVEPAAPAVEPAAPAVPDTAGDLPRERRPRTAARPEAQPRERAAQDAEAAAEPGDVPRSDSELIHRAAKALRHDGDPALAARLLRAQRAKGTTGPLAEEALALEIEAAIALRSPRAAELAREYMTRYPHGRYAAIAARALADAAP